MDIYWSINLFLLAALTAVVARKREIVYFLTAIVVYLTFHHAYGVVPIFMSETSSQGESVAKTLRQGHGMLPQLIGMVFLISMMSFAVYRSYKAKVKLSVLKPIFLLFSLAFLWMVMFGVVLGADFFIQGVVPSLQALKDFVSTSFMLVFSFVLAIYFYSERNIELERLPWNFLFSLIILVLLIGIFEILTSQAWAGAGLSVSVRSYRASSVLFNPNVLGIWGALLVVFAAYLNITGRGERWVSYVLTVSGATSIFLGASRSSLALCLLMLLLLPLFLKRAGIFFSKGIRPLVFFTGIFCIITFSASFSAVLVGQNNVSVLSGRFLSLGQVLSNVVNPHEHTKASPYMSGAIRGIDGRLGGETADNGYLAIKEGGGWFPMIVWIGFFLAAMMKGMRLFWYYPNVSGAFAMISMIGVAALGMIMRAYQVFPVWGFVSLMLSVYFVWFISNSESKM